MPTWLIGPALKGLMIIGLMIALWGAWHSFTGHYKDIGRAEVQAKWDKDKEARIKALTAVTLMWDKKRQELEQEQTDHERDRAARFAPITVASTNLPKPVRDVPVPAAAVGVLNRAISASNSVSSPTPSKSGEETGPTPADTDLGSVVDWGVNCARQYAEVVDQVLGLQKAYNNVRGVCQ